MLEFIDLMWLHWIIIPVMTAPRSLPASETYGRTHQILTSLHIYHLSHYHTSIGKSHNHHNLINSKCFLYIVFHHHINISLQCMPLFTFETKYTKNDQTSNSGATQNGMLWDAITYVAASLDVLSDALELITYL